MADEVAHKIKNASVGVEGGAYISPNGLKIVADPPSRVSPTINNTLNDVALSGKYVNRFDDPTYYTA